VGIEKNLNLYDKLHNRIQEIHDTIGEDSNILDETEHLNPAAMYAIYETQGGGPAKPGTRGQAHSTYHLQRSPGLNAAAAKSSSGMVKISLTYKAAFLILKPEKLLIRRGAQTFVHWRVLSESLKLFKERSENV
jgi:hypothetical protein